MRKVAGGYGRWLGFLRWHGWLDLAEPAAQRPTAERLDAFFEELLALCNADQTVVGRFAELHQALRIIAPRTPRPDIVRPGGESLRNCLAMRRRKREVRAPAELYGWGLALMEGALRRAPRRRQVQLRDGLLICIRGIRERRTWPCSARPTGRTPFAAGCAPPPPAARRSPKAAMDAATVLGHAVETSVQHCAEASGLHAALRHGDAIARRRQELLSSRSPSKPR